jgi:hypothetical protein
MIYGFDTTSIPYSLSSYSGSAWISVGSAGGTKINDWVASTSYKIGEYVVKDSLLYRCTSANSDSIFTSSNWTLISGHMIRDNSQFYTKRSNLKFIGDGVSISDDATNDNTVITISGNVTTSGTQTIQNKLYADSTDSTKQFNYDISGITTGTTRTIKVQDKDGTMALLSNINGFDYTKAYNSGDIVIAGGYHAKANNSIPAGTQFAWGISGATWSPIFPSDTGFIYTWKGLYTANTTYVNGDVFITSNTLGFPLIRV